MFDNPCQTLSCTARFGYVNVTDMKGSAGPQRKKFCKALKRQVMGKLAEFLGLDADVVSKEMKAGAGPGPPGFRAPRPWAWAWAWACGLP